MQRARRWVFWLPAAAWMVLIYIGSTGVLAAPRTSRLIGPFLRWLVPGIADATVDAIVFFVRKCAHAAEYGLLALLLLAALHQTFRLLPRAWNARYALLAFGLAAGYAVTDEFHQSLVPTRQGSAYDVLLDAVGAAATLAALWAWGRWRRRW